MTTIDLTEATARRALGSLVDDSENAVSRYARALWSALIEPGDRVAGELVAAVGAARALEIAMTDAGPLREAVDIDALELVKGRARWQPRLGGAAEALETARRADVRLVTPDHFAWPARANDLGPFAPVCLWLQGDPGRLVEGVGTVAIVGARASTAYGEQVAADLAAGAVAAGVTVYSGAAYGIDAAAHTAALSAGGRTVAVMAGGLDRPYPTGNRRMIEQIARTGAVVAEVPCGSAPTKHRFLGRNRLIAAFGDATVVVEAGWRSGALNTAHHAQAIGRPVGAVPGPVTSASSMGCHRLLREGAVECVTGPADLLELAGVSEAPLPPVPAGYIDESTRVRDAVSARGARATADIARRAGLAVDETAALLGILELEGVVTRRGAGWVQLAGRTAATLW
ncbi:MAG: DNA-processing protein DprA [Microbacterium sp.]